MENTDDCIVQYQFDSALYLISFMSQCYYIIIVLGIITPGYGKEVVDGLNAVDNPYIYQLMFIVQLPGLNRFDSQMQMHTGNQNYGVSLPKTFQQHLTK